MGYILKKINLLLVIALLLFISCENKNSDIYVAEFESNQSKLENIHIGLYTDSGAEGVYMVEDMLNEIGSNYSTISKSIILNDELSIYDIILFPGGDMWEYKNYLSEKGLQIIKDYVQAGGGYIGICGGSYFSANTIIWRGWEYEERKYAEFSGLGIFSGIADGPIEDFAPSYYKYKCGVNINQNHEITNDIPQQLSYLYSFGPKFIISDSTNISILGKTVLGDNPVILSVEEQEGRVFLTSLHPEIDESKESWNMIRNAILWCGYRTN